MGIDGQRERERKDSQLLLIVEDVAMDAADGFEGDQKDEQFAVAELQ